MEPFSRGLRVQIYFGETDRSGHKPLYQALLELLRNEGAAGATVTRGIAGFGRESLIKTAAILRLSLDLPTVVTWIDAPERVERLLPRVQALAGSGVITVEEVGIASYGERAVGKMRFDLQVRDVMTSDVRSVRSSANVRAAVESLIGRHFRALPVINGGDRLVGVVSNGDLVARGGLGARLELLNVMSEVQRRRFLDRLPDRAVADVMTPDPVTLSPTATLAEATRLFSERHLKRLPVVDKSGVLMGILSRADVLRAVAEAFPRRENFAALPPGGARSARDVMRLDAPVVRDDADLPAVLDAVCSTRLNRAVVVDSTQRVIGVISDAALLRALGPDSGGVVGTLMGKVGLGGRHEGVARELMVAPALSVAPEAPLSEIARVMTEHRRKVVPVTDAADRLLGVVDRADLLAATGAALFELTTTQTIDEEE
jgi:CBS domain-containing protein